MPAYDYKCPACERVFEVTRGIRDKSEITCPACETSAKRVYSPVGIVFKGTGFHNTDYPKKTATAATAAAPESAPAETKSSEKAEKPAPCGGESSPACTTCPAAAK